MDEYRQPRPILYGTWEDEAPAQTLTLPVRIGPPRYPPAPPLAGDAPDPWEPSRSGSSATTEWDKPPSPDIRLVLFLSLLFAASLAYSLLQVYLGIDQGLLLTEICVGALVLASLWWLNSRSYFVALRLVAVPIILGVIFAQWLSPLLYVSLITMIYLLRPSLREYYNRLAEIASIKKHDQVNHSHIGTRFSPRRSNNDATASQYSGRQSRLN